MADVDVLIAGAGPAGTSTAYRLARAGVRVQVLDRAHFPRSKPCAESLSPQASRILADMGALESVERSGAAMLSGVRVHAPNGAVIAGDFVAGHGFRGFRDRALSVRRDALDTILLDRARAAGVRVTEGVRVTGVSTSPAGRAQGVTTLDARGAGEVRARIVIAADGLRSLIARRLGLARTRRWPRRIAVVAHYAGVDGVGEHSEMHVERDGYAGIADVGRGLTTVALVVPIARAREVARDRAGFLDAWLRARSHLAPRFARASHAGPVAVTGPFASHSRRAWAPGAALVGDAADFFDPFTGEGIYAALRGGELLADWTVEALGAASPARADEAMAAYDAARRAEFRGKWLVERVIGAVVGSVPLINRAAGNLAARKGLADLLIGVTGNFVPPREVIRAGYLWSVFGPRQRGPDRSGAA